MSSRRGKCAYCRESRVKSQMTDIPVERRRLHEWFDALGCEFAEACNSRLHAQICVSHFKFVYNGRRENTAIPMPLPFCNENVGQRIRKRMHPKESEESSKIVANNTMIPIRTCIICGFVCKNEQLVPEASVTTFVCPHHYFPPVWPNVHNFHPPIEFKNKEMVQQPESRRNQLASSEK